MTEDEIEEIVRQMMSAWESENWYLLIADCVMLLLFAIGMFFSIYGKVESIRLKKQNAELLKEQAKSQAEKQQIEIKLRGEYAESMQRLSDTCIGKVQDNIDKQKAEAEARAKETQRKIVSSEKTLDDLLGD